MKKPKQLSTRSDNHSVDEGIANTASYWQARQASEQMTEEEKQDFQAWLAQNSAHRRIYDEITGLWQHPDLAAALKTIPLSSKRNETLSHRPRILRKPLLWLAPMAVATICAVIALHPLLYWQADYLTDIGEQRTITLSDGSEVTLNTDTALELAYQEHERRIRLLKGEAYFAVTKNPSRPFIVDSGELETRVLGTHFFVRNGDDKDTVTVLEGHVEVSDFAHKHKAVLTRGERISGTKTEIIEVSQAPESAGAWLEQHLIFENTSLPDVIDELSRYLPGIVYLADREILSAVKVNARLNLKNPRTALDALEQTLPIKISHAGPWLAMIRPQ